GSCWAGLRGLRIDPEGRRRCRHRVFECHRAGNSERSQPGEAGGKIAEALAEENTGQERIRVARAYALSAGAANTPSQTGGDHHLVRLVLVEQSFQPQCNRIESRPLIW